MKSLLNMFVTECEYKNLPPLTVKTYKTDIGYLIEFLEGIGVTDIEKLMLTHLKRLVVEMQKRPLYAGMHRENQEVTLSPYTETFQYGKRWYYCDEFFEAVKLLSIAESMVQGILSIDRDPNSIEKVEVWLFDRNPLLLEVIQGKLLGCTVETVVLPEFKSRRKGASTYALAQMAAEMLKERKGGRLTKAELRMKLGIGKRTLADSLIRQDVLEDFAKQGMTVGNRYIEWTQ